jgi:hypothetical protein
MRDLNFQLRIIYNRNQDGGKGTIASRWRNLDLAARQLHELGFKGLTPRNLKPKHVVALVKLWNEQKLALSTIKNRVAALRWWAEKVGKPDVIPPNNDALNIGQRVYVTNVSKAVVIDDDVLVKVPDPNIRVSLELQRAFGLRREESLKFQPSYAIQENSIQLKGSWCKGGQERVIPIRNDYQREVLKRVSELAGQGSLIPRHLKYVQHLKRYEKACVDAGLHKLHGLRHAYAQQRYEEITGWKAPAAGGPKSSELTPEQKKVDRAARLTISEELGHHRESITAVYLGR